MGRIGTIWIALLLFCQVQASPPRGAPNNCAALLEALELATTRVVQTADGGFDVLALHENLPDGYYLLARYDPCPNGRGFNVSVNPWGPNVPAWVANPPISACRVRELNRLDAQKAQAEEFERQELEQQERERQFYAARFGITEPTLAALELEVSEVLLVTDAVTSEGLATALAITRSRAATEVLQRGLHAIGIRGQSADRCEQIAEYLFPLDPISFTLDLDNPDQVSIHILLDSLNLLRRFHFSAEADRRARELFAELGCR